jgi:hypothetical protein
VTLKEMGIFDSVGLPKFDERRAQAMVNLVKKERRLQSEPPPCEGRGIVIAGGGKYLSHAWIGCQIIRDTGCQLPIQIWYLGAKEMPAWVKPYFDKLGVETVDAFQVMKKHPVMKMSGWHLKTFAIEHCPWEQVLFLDADCVPTGNPEELMSMPEVGAVGGLFFSDIANHCQTTWGYVFCSLLPMEKEWEAGQYIVSKRTGWMGLRWTNWLLEHSDVWFRLGWGDKFCLELGFRVSGVPLIVSTECEWKEWGISQQWRGVERFRHMMAAKRGEGSWPEDVGRRFREWKAFSLGK